MFSQPLYPSAGLREIVIVSAIGGRVPASVPVSVRGGVIDRDEPFHRNIILGRSIGMVGKVTNMAQAELGQAALKVGETVLGGMELLGGMAYDAAK